MSINRTAILLGPAAKPPLGVTTNFDDIGLRYLIVALGVVCSTIATVLVGLRMYVKLFIIKKAHWEDAFCVACWVSYLGYIGGKSCLK